MHNKDLGSWITQRAQMTPAKTALCFEDTQYSYAEFHTRITEIACGIRSLGLKPGDRIGYMGANHPAFLETMFAAAKVGAIFVPIHIQFPVPDIIHVINDSGCGFLVYGSHMVSIVEQIRNNIGVKQFIAVGEISRDDQSLSSLAAHEYNEHIDQIAGMTDLFFITYTSGTTGKPKGVMLSHGNLTWNVFNVLSCADYTSDDVLLIQAPLYRMGAMGMLALPGLYKGATLVITQETDAEKLFRIIERYGVTILFGGPEFFRSLLTVLERKDVPIPSIRFCTCGGDIIPEPLIRAWLDRGVRFQQGYGLTEASPLVLLLDKDEMLTKIGSSGKPPLFTDVRVVNPDFTDVLPGGVGEIIARGPNIMMGYWNLPDVTEQKITGDGWLRTGDAARIDNDGHIYVLGRVDDAMVLEGRLIYPAEIEKKLSGYPEVDDSAVSGKTVHGKARITAFVVLKSNISITGEKLINRLRTELPPGQIPTHIKFVDSIPRNANGKIIRQKLLA